MKSDTVASAMLSVLFWSMLLSSMFVAPTFLAARSVDDEAQAELIRQHHEVTSRMVVPTQDARPGMCEQPAGGPAMSETDAPTQTNAPTLDAGPDQPMIKPIGKRKGLIQV